MGLDNELAALKAVPADLPRQDLEISVWNTIAGVREARSYARVVFAVRAFAIVCATGVGLIGGSLATAAVKSGHHEASVFSTHLAPSALLGSHG